MKRKNSEIDFSAPLRPALKPTLQFDWLERIRTLRDMRELASAPPKTDKGCVFRLFPCEKY